MRFLPKFPKQHDICYGSQSDGSPETITLEKVERDVVAFVHAMRGWYIENKRRKRLLSKVLRFIAVVSLISGGLYPVVAQWTHGNPFLGYILLGAAGGLYILDRMFDISSSWLRDVTAMQAINRSIFRYDVERAELALRDGIDEHIKKRRLNAIKALANDVFEAASKETTEWHSAFQTAFVDLGQMVKSSEAEPHPTVARTL
jgi:hypothetical protein